MKTAEKQIYGDVFTINVDVQNDFALPTGALSVTDGEAVIGPLNRINNWTRDNGGSVIMTADWHPTETEHFATYGGIWPEHCIEDTHGAVLHSNLSVQPFDTVAIKGTSMKDDGYSGLEAVPVAGSMYDATNPQAKTYTIEQAIRSAEAYRAEQHQRLAILVGGLATDYCVKATVLDALAATSRENVDVVLLRNAIRAVNLTPIDGDEALKAMIEAGALAMTTEEIIAGGISIDETRLEC